MNSFILFENSPTPGTGNIVDRWILRLVYELGGYGLILYILITMLIAAILSSIIGFERYLRGENAGIRTHALLAIGCSFLMTISIFAIRIADGSLDITNGMIESSSNNLSYDTSRIAAAVVTGIGFLGAGVIIKDKFTVKGLSTATTLWISAAIGLACGAGFILEAIIATVITVFIVFVRNRIIVRVDHASPHVIVKTKLNVEIIDHINELSLKDSLNLKAVDVIEIDEETVTIKASYPYNVNRLTLKYFCHQLEKIDGVISTEIVAKKSKGKHGNTLEG